MTAAIAWVYLYFTLRNCFRKPWKCFRRAFTRDHTALWRLFSTEPARTSTQTLHCHNLPESRVPAEDLHHWYYASICISFLRNCFRNSHGPKSDKTAWKQNSTRNSHSRSFKVTRVRITESEKSTTDCVAPYNNDGLISKVSEEVAIEIVEHCRTRQPHCRLTPLPREPPRIST